VAGGTETAAVADDLTRGWILYATVLRNFKPNTVRVYTGHFKTFFRYLSFRKQNPFTVTFRFLEAWMVHMHQEEKKPKTIKDCIVAITSLYHWLKREGKVDHNPADDLEPIHVDRPLPEFWTEPQVEKILAAGRTARDRAILEVLYASGARQDEVRGINMEWLNLDDGTAKVRGKGGQEGLLHFTEEAVKAVRAWLPERTEILAARGREHEQALFVSSLGQRLSYYPLWKMVHDTAARAGVSGPAHPHMFRHSAATHLLNRGMDLRAVQEFLRHGVLASTEIYTHVAQDRLKAELRRTHPRARRNP